jgi:RNA polymerase sigma factor (sigma-70 family)
MPDDQKGRLTLRLAEARAGAEDALEDLLRCLHPILLRFAHYRLSDENEASELARDLTQDTLVAIIQSVGSCEAETNAQMIAWAQSILQNRINDHFRAGARAARIQSELVVHLLHDEPPAEDEKAARERALGRRVLRGIVQDVVDQLPPSRLRLLHLRVSSGAQWAQIAAEFGIERDAARRRFHRLRAYLRKAILKRLAGLEPRKRKAAQKVIREDPP